VLPILNRRLLPATLVFFLRQGAEDSVALVGPELAAVPAYQEPARLGMRARIVAAVGWARGLLAVDKELSLTRYLAGTVFVIRVASAVLAYFAQVLLARWLGGSEFGICAYSWTVLLLAGGLATIGLESASQRFIPEYTARGETALLRGYLVGSRWLVLIVATAIAGACATGITIFKSLVGADALLPLYIVCAGLPIYCLAGIQSGIARSYNWVNLALLPTYMLRQVVLLLSVCVIWALGLPATATVATLAWVVTLWGVTMGQLVVLSRRLRPVIEGGPKLYAVRAWLGTSMPILLVESFYLLLTYSDVIVLRQFRPPGEVAVYFAAAKSLSFVAFIHFAVSQTVAHKFSEYHVTGDRRRLAQSLHHSVRLTFWPTVIAVLGIVTFGRPVLRLFGAGFEDGYHLMLILSIGLLARASVGPGERLLNMLGERYACALICFGAFAINLGLCVWLIPTLGLDGAAVAVAAALIFESLSLFLVAKYRLGLRCLIFGGSAEVSPAA